MNRTQQAISPHLGDAIFSAGGTLAQRAAQSWQVVVATCFTQSVHSPAGFALACQLDKGLSVDVDSMALRRKEDYTACAAIGTGTGFVHLPLPEAPHREYESAAALFVKLQLVLILGPAAIGGLVDHVLVRRALTAMGRGTVPLRVREDWPGDDRNASAFSVSPATFVLEETKLAAEDFARKVAGCRVYAS